MLQRIKRFLKDSVTTLCYFIGVSVLMPFLPIGLLLMVGMSTDSGMNSLSIYIMGDIFQLLLMSLIPFMCLGIFYVVPGIVLFVINTTKKIGFSFKYYTLFVLLYSLPFGGMLFGLHGNFDIAYKEERNKQILIANNHIIDGT